ncbi:AT-hook motif nuclear-localized protein 7-like [Panicum miliaceum]|uniref:AT-hook motif nuclear-localized protein n=1 Tax=Panicum miliaceum TaxID=4540 RepID=A0A3L6PTD5_PANMI|nr:AT-hook motif nuclear-localized protein 7-like [Panicum miliaceum]
MEAKSGEASAGPAPAPMAAAAAPVVTAAPEATVSFQSPAVEKGSSSGVLVSPPATGPPPAAGPPAAAGPGGALALGPVAMKVPKKRGRPRKYGPDGSLIRPLNATPISASAPMAAAVAAGQYTPASAVGAAMKRGRGRPLDFAAAAAAGKHHQHHQLHHHQSPFGFHFDSIGDMVACSAGANFTPHIITVAPGEDVTMKVISFSQQGPRAICILSANGVISNVTLRQPDSSGGTLTYEGRFELLSLSGSFMPTENSGTRSRSGGMSVSLASPDGRVVGGGVAGLLVAASPVQIVVGTFLPSYQMEQKNKKPRVDPAPTLPQTPPAIPISSVDTHSGDQGQHSSAVHQRTASVSYGADQSWVSPAQQPTPEASGDQKTTASGS